MAARRRIGAISNDDPALDVVPVLTDEQRATLTPDNILEDGLDPSLQEGLDEAEASGGAARLRAETARTAIARTGMSEEMARKLYAIPDNVAI